MSQSTRAAAPRSALATAIKAVVAIALSVVTLWWALRDVDLGYVTANLTRTSTGAVAFYVLSQVAIHASRVVRYSLLVRPLGPVSMRAVFAAVSVGLPAAVFLPLRLGEFVRPLMISRAGLPLPGAFASVVVERVADGLFNVGLFFVLLQLIPASAHVDPDLQRLALLPLAGFGGGLVFLVLAYLARERVLGLTERIIGLASVPFARKIVALISTFLDGLVALGTWQRVASFLGLTLFYWGLNGFSTYVFAAGYGLDLPVVAGWFAITCVVFAVTVPAGPAFAGTLEAGFRAGMTPFGVGASDIALVAIAAHVLQLVMLALFAAAGLQAAESSQREHKAPEGPSAGVEEG